MLPRKKAPRFSRYDPLFSACAFTLNYIAAKSNVNSLAKIF
jgi:hypothetical protein